MIAGIGESDIGSAGIHGGSMLVLTTVGDRCTTRFGRGRQICWQLLEQTKMTSAQTSVQATEENRGTFGRKLKMRWKGAFE
jgi:hypothetical protein